MKRNTIIGQHSLVISLNEDKTFVSKICNYEDLKEVRLDLEQLEVTVLMTYDDSYFRVFKIELKDDAGRKEAEQKVMKFYSDLLNASMRLTPEEAKAIAEQRQKMDQDHKKAHPEESANKEAKAETKNNE